MPAQNHVVIGIHGLSRKPPKDKHEAEWKESICEGLSRNAEVNVTADRLGFELVYWADWLGLPPYGPGEDTEPYARLSNDAPLLRYRQRFRDVFLQKALASLGEPIDWVNEDPTLKQIRRQIGIDDLGVTLLKKRLVDLGTYYADEQKRKMLRKRITDKLIEHKSKRIMLVAHSMGSIVAYEVLRELGRAHPDLVVEHFVTLGSPLGLNYVYSRIRAENPAVRTPSMVRRWTNLSDRRDPVAFDVHLGDEYEANDDRVKVEDALVVNSYVSPAGEHNPHKIFGYLRAPEFSDIAKTFI